MRFRLQATQSQGPIRAPQCRAKPQLVDAFHGRPGCWRQLDAAPNGTRDNHSTSNLGSRRSSKGTDSRSNIIRHSIKGSIRGHSSISSGGGNHVVRVPSLGDSITEGTVSKWLVGEGSVVNAEDVLCLLETDKVSVEITAKVAGKVVNITAAVGNNVLVGGELALIEPLSPGEAAAADADGTTAAAPGVAVAPVQAPQAGAGDAAAEAPTLQRRTPTILFRSVRNRLERLGLLPHPKQSQPQPQQAQQHLLLQQQQQRKPQGEASSSSCIQHAPSTAVDSHVTVIRYAAMEDLPPCLQRPKLSAEEVQVINEGGLANADNAVRAWTVSLCFSPRNPEPAAVAAASAKGTKKGPPS